MSGHSKWATIKHKKAATDAKRGRVFTKLIREITIAARVGGGDAIANPRLRTAVAAAKNENMPNENIERAIQRGTGQLEGEQYEEVMFEGYGPGGVGMLVHVVTSNRNRVVSEIRHVMGKNGGNLAEAGAVGWMFHRKGDIAVPKEQANEDKLLSIVLDAGAEDRSEEHTSELQSLAYLVCRLLLEKKKNKYKHRYTSHRRNSRNYPRFYTHHSRQHYSLTATPHTAHPGPSTGPPRTMRHRQSALRTSR